MYINGQYGFGWYNPDIYDSSGNTRDGHGGRAEEHHEEMRQIATMVVNELAPKIAAEIYNKSLENLMGAVNYDVETYVQVAVDSMEEIFKSSKVKQICSDAIMKELQRSIKVDQLKIGF